MCPTNTASVHWTMADTMSVSGHLSKNPPHISLKGKWRRIKFIWKSNGQLMSEWILGCALRSENGTMQMSWISLIRMDDWTVVRCFFNFVSSSKCPIFIRRKLDKAICAKYTSYSVFGIALDLNWISVPFRLFIWWNMKCELLYDCECRTSCVLVRWTVDIV